MTTDSMKDKVLARIRKMVKLAEDAGASEGERDNAMRSVFKYLAKYNLTLEDIPEDQRKDEERSRVEEPWVGYPWVYSVCTSIARLYFCHYFYQKMTQDKSNNVFIGRHSNAVTAKEMSKFVVYAVHYQARKYAKDMTGRDATSGGFAEYRAFAQGAMIRIQYRCSQLREEAEKDGIAPDAEDSTPGTALVIAGLYEREQIANDKFIEKTVGKLKEGRTQTLDGRQRHAHMAGDRFGSTVSLNKQVK